MYLKSLSFVFGLAISLLTPNAFAQDRPGPSRSKTSIRRLCLTDPSSFLKPKKAMPPATCTQNIAMVDHRCGAVLVDHYGPPVKENDKELKQAEQRMCTQIATNSRDGE